MTRRPRPCYDGPEFRQMWFDKALPLRVIADRYGVSVMSVWRAGLRRGFPHRNEL